MDNNVYCIVHIIILHIMNCCMFYWHVQIYIHTNMSNIYILHVYISYANGHFWYVLEGCRSILHVSTSCLWLTSIHKKNDDNNERIQCILYTNIYGYLYFTSDHSLHIEQLISLLNDCCYCYHGWHEHRYWLLHAHNI